jgi:hypothetical protein
MLRSCPACGSTSYRPVAEHLGAEVFRLCPDCGLQHIGNIATAVPVFQDFSAAVPATSGWAAGNGGGLPLTSNESAILRWLERTVPPHSPVLEVCCESGRFLAGLKSRDFDPLGMDPLPAHVEALRRTGLKVAPGSAEAYPSDWPEPSAVVMLESLVRFPDPAGLINAIRRRFPGAPLGLSVPTPRRSLRVPEFDRRLDYPPHHLTRWTRPALKHLLGRAGYRGRCWVCHVRMNWNQGSMKKRLLRIAYAAGLRLLGEFDYSICAIGLPKPERSWKP